MIVFFLGKRLDLVRNKQKTDAHIFSPPPSLTLGLAWSLFYYIYLTTWSVHHMQTLLFCKEFLCLSFLSPSLSLTFTLRTLYQSIYTRGLLLPFNVHFVVRKRKNTLCNLRIIFKPFFALLVRLAFSELFV